ncbi:FG-GAP-like repeat-containing protein [Paracraurococcus ruber]|uniref:Cadherin domain-containing protein n=1 Tax=Paracraurococcus ruber TaxID=77675 RepID=A0ABS1CX63_9PROT|nr:FG-GAP-like repeat-containing protein [Paracraurococcus ruber]MBK1659126.1 hypothetical protein [Paracraurococcus ruber]TDG30261.1 hypothetical protein E2C05_15050 [Paracraurococcus ruber]
MAIRLGGLAGSVTVLENTVNATPQFLDDSVEVTFPGGAAPRSLTVSGLLAEDRVSLRNQGSGASQVSVVGGNVFVADAFVGTVQGGIGATLTVSFAPPPFAPPLTALALDAVVQALAYGNASDAPAAERLLTLRITDASGPAVSETIRVTVTAENDAPLVTSAGSASVAENGAGIAYQATASDPDGAPAAFAWTLGGPDAGRFTVDAAGAVRFAAPADFETPGSAAGSNAYRITLLAFDGAAFSAARPVTIAVTDLAEPPTLGGLPASLQFAEPVVKAAPRILFPGAVLTAGDGLAGGRLSIGGLLPEDRVAVPDQGNGPGQVGFDGTVLRYGGVAIGTATGGDGSALLLRFDAAATEAAAQAVLRSLTYGNGGDLPTASRSLTLLLTDAKGQASAGPWTPSFVPLAGAADPLPAGVALGSRTAPALGDIDGDGRPDLVVGSLAGALTAFRNTGQGFAAFGPGRLAGVTTGPYSVPALGDIDGDGRDDLLLGTQGGTLAAWRNTGTSFEAFAAAWLAAIPPGSFSAPALGDLDGDGRPDLVLGDANGTLTAYRNTGARFEAFAANPLGGIAATGFATAALADLDGDGRADLVFWTYPVAAEAARVEARRNTGTGFEAFATDPLAGIPVGDLGVPALGDITGDGVADLVLGDISGALSAWRGVAPLAEVTLGVTPVNRPPVVTAPAALAVAENGTAALFRATATDPDGPGPILWSLAGDDAALFAIDALGTVNFRARPDFEAPRDRDGDNAYDIHVVAADGMDSAARAVRITVTDLPEVPSLAGFGPFAAFAEEQANAAPRLLAPGIAFTQGDTLAGARLTIAGLLPEDRVTILAQGDGPGQIGVEGATLRFGGTAIGTAEGGVGAPFSVLLNGAATAAAVQALLGRLAFADASDRPTLFRTLTLDLVQADGGALGGPAAPAFAPAGAANPFRFAAVDQLAAPALGDIDGDGRTDLVLGRYDGTLVAVRNTVAGPALYAIDPVAGIDVGFYSTPSLGDIDGDGRLDLVVGSYDGPVIALRNTGTRFEAFAADPLARVTTGFVTAPALGDIDGDGRADLLLGQDDGTLAAWRNEGGVFVPFATNPVAGIDVGDLSAPSLGDIDGDGRADLIAGGIDGTLAAWRNTGTGFLPFAANPVAGFDVGTHARPALGDVTGDGRPDLLVGAYTGEVAGWRNAIPPAASITVAVTPSNDLPAGPQVQALAASPQGVPRVITPAQLLAGWTDADGDALAASGLTLLSGQGRLAANGDSGWTYTPAAGDASGAAFAFTVSDGTARVTGTATLDLLPRPPVAEDFFGDGSGDILFRGAGGEAVAWRLAGTAVADAALLGTPGPGWQVAGTGDLDGDRKADILWRGEDGRLALWRMDGLAATTVSDLGLVGRDWQVAALGDLNGDGRADIVWREAGGDVVAWLMNGATVLGGGLVGRTGPDWRVVAAADADADGRADLLLRHGPGGEVGLWRMDGLAVTGGGLIGAPGPGWEVAGSGDFNGDGRADILWRSAGGTLVEWWLDGQAVTGGGLVGTPGPDWQVAAVSDHDGDGRADLLLRAVDGTLALWLLEGTTLRGAAALGNPGTYWEVA